MLSTLTDAQPRIDSGRTLEFHLQVCFQDGFEALSTFEETPLRCTIGDGTLTPALESMIQGLEPGSETCLVANGSDLFSPYEESNRYWLDRREFPPDLIPAPGLLVAFETPAGHAISGLILEVEETRVHVDLNHPFAGRILTLRMKVLSVQ